MMLNLERGTEPTILDYPSPSHLPQMTCVTNDLLTMSYTVSNMSTLQ